LFSGDIFPEGDWSNAAFFLVAGAIGKEVELYGLNPDSVQGDKEMLSVLIKAGAKVEIKNTSIKVKTSELKGFYMDAENCPDLVPIVAVLAAVAKGESVIKNVERLKIKESDRIESTINTLKAFGIKAVYKDNSLVVYGSTPASGTVDSYNDHRIVMAAAVLASASEGETLINGAEAVQKSYPDFFKDFIKLGGKAEYGC
jgi:3-phosphoshikimate 1-carboxyvinyltransferase